MVREVTGREVSARLTALVLEAAERAGLDTRALCEDLGLSYATFTSVEARVSWDNTRKLFAALGQRYSSEELRQLGERIGRGKVPYPFLRLIRFGISTRELLASTTISWQEPSRRMLSNVEASHRFLGVGHTQLTFWMTGGYEACPELWTLMQGGLSSAPVLLGLPEAQVQLTVRERSAEFDIRHAEHPPLRRYVASWTAAVRWSFRARSELQRVQDRLTARYEDLTQALEQQRRTQRALAESRSMFHDVFKRAPSAMIITRERDAAIVDANPAFEELLGYTRDELIGRSASDFKWWQEDEVRAAMRRQLEEQGFAYGREARFTIKGGSERVLLVSAQRLNLEGEACILWNGLDVTAARRAERERRVQGEREKEKEKLESLGLLAGGIAHDFNNLLVGMLGNAELAAQQLPDGVPAKRLLEDVATSAERAAMLTRELLDYAGRGSTRLAPVEMRELTSEVVRLTSHHVPKQARVRLELPTEELWVNGDRGQLTRMLMNLLKNAAEALQGGAGEVVIGLEPPSGDPAQKAVLTVRDTGLGMDEATRAKLFEPFFTTKAEGHGLGLAAVLGIVHRHAGDIEVKSQPGSGTSFRITLPTRAPPAPPPSEVSKTPLPVPSGRVLVVDDDARVRGTAAMMLDQQGFEVSEAESGERALAMFRADPSAYRIIMLDGTMPGLDGAQTLAALREIDAKVPVLLCSGYSRADFARKLSGQPKVAFLRKPFRGHELATAIAGLLNGTTGEGG